MVRNVLIDWYVIANIEQDLCINRKVISILPGFKESYVPAMMNPILTVSNPQTEHYSSYLIEYFPIEYVYCVSAVKRSNGIYFLGSYKWEFMDKLADKFSQVTVASGGRHFAASLPNIFTR